MDFKSVDLIVHIVMGFIIRKIFSGDSILDPNWMIFVIMLTASFLMIDTIEFCKVIGDENKKREKWYKLIARNMSIVFTQKIVY